MFPRASPNSQLFLREQAIFRLLSLFFEVKEEESEEVPGTPARPAMFVAGYLTRIADIRKERGSDEDDFRAPEKRQVTAVRFLWHGREEYGSSVIGSVHIFCRERSHFHRQQCVADMQEFLSSPSVQDILSFGPSGGDTVSTT